MNLIATEARINTEDVIAFTTKTQLFFCIMQPMTNEQMANELLNLIKKAIPVSGNRW